MPRTFETYIAALAAICAPALALPQAAGAQDEPDLDDLRARFEAAFNAGDVDALGQLYAENAIILPPDYARIEGRDGLAGYFDASFAQRQASDLAISSAEDRRIDGAYLDTGTYAMTVEGPDGARVPVEGDYASLVEEIDGEWRITRHIWNQDRPQ